MHASSLVLCSSLLVVNLASSCCLQVMDLWKRVNPGVMESYVAMPDSTMTDHFQWLPEQQEALKMTHHFKKTDFSEYNEVAARSMKGLITNKSSA